MRVYFYQIHMFCFFTKLIFWAKNYLQNSHFEEPDNWYKSYLWVMFHKCVHVAIRYCWILLFPFNFGETFVSFRTKISDKTGHTAPKPYSTRTFRNWPFFSFYHFSYINGLFHCIFKIFHWHPSEKCPFFTQQCQK